MSIRRKYPMEENKEIRKPHEILEAMDKYIRSKDDSVLLEQLTSELQVSLAHEADETSKRNLSISEGNLKVAKLGLAIAFLALLISVISTFGGCISPKDSGSNKAVVDNSEAAPRSATP